MTLNHVVMDFVCLCLLASYWSSHLDLEAVFIMVAVTMKVQINGLCVGGQLYVIYFMPC